jgi:glycerol kinase
MTLEPGSLEHDPQVLFDALLAVTRNLFANSGFDASSVIAMGICNQRGSFLLWEKSTGKPVTNLISWADIRSGKTAEAMNHYQKWLRLKHLAKIVGAITGSDMMNVSARFIFSPEFATVRLKWLFDTHPELHERCKKGELLFGTLDTWFTYNLTGKKNHITDASNAAATGIFDPFARKWNKIICDLFDFPMNIFPNVIDTNGDFGSTEPELFDGISIPIRATAGDQMAAMFGQRCFEPGSIKISQGSGAFVDINVGSKVKYSKRGLFPIVGWVLNGKPTYLLEGNVVTAGTLIDWLGEGIGLSDTPQVLNEFASQCDDTEGVIFIPSPAGLRFPYFNSRVKASILGLSLNTHRCHVARAVLEGLALCLTDIIRGMSIDTKIPIKVIKVDGGVSKSDILLQILSDLTNVVVKRAPESDMTATGIAYLAGLGAGIWKNIDEIKSLEENYNDFEPNMDPIKRKEKLAQWDKTIHHLLELY